MKVLVIGDIFGRPGRRAVTECLPDLIREEGLELVIANGENAAGGKGITPAICEQFFELGVDVITNGNHVRDQKSIDPVLETNPRVLRPLNYPPTMPGRGYAIVEGRSGKKLGIINAIGRVHMGEIPSPFLPALECVQRLREETSAVVMDFHAEATSEKRAMGWWLDGKISAVVGTHTHVQTADEEVLPGGTAYITDVGMTGPYDSIIGLRTDLGLERFVKGVRGQFDVAKDDIRFSSVLIDLDDSSGKARSIRRIRKDLAS